MNYRRLRLRLQNRISPFDECARFETKTASDRAFCISVRNSSIPVEDRKTALDKSNSQSVTSNMFIATVRKYTRAKTLTPKMVNELIQYIEVHQAEKIEGVWEQRIISGIFCSCTL